MCAFIVPYSLASEGGEEVMGGGFRRVLKPTLQFIEYMTKFNHL